MRTLIFFTLGLFIVSCKSAQTTSSHKDTDPLLELNNRWQLAEVNGQSIENTKYNSIPSLEFKTEELRFNGSDGCNNFFGQLKVLDEKSMSFGLMGSTKAYCPDMKLPEQLGKSLNAVTFYNIKKGNLLLFDAEGKELLRYRKAE